MDPILKKLEELRAKQNKLAKPSRKNAGENEIYVYDVIGPADWGYFGAATMKDELKNLGSDVTEVVIRINSVGGYVGEASAIYQLLKEHPANIHVKIDGEAISCASWIAMAGDKITIAEHGLMMVHDPSTWISGTADDLRKEAEVLDSYKEVIAGIYAARSGTDVEDVKKMMSDETWMTATQAKDKGFVDEISANKSKPEATNFKAVHIANWQMENIRRRQQLIEAANA
ncbi:head maturation protease, ClpP-related [Planctopirus limnophila]|nr:head maturation protease, ClpP-related [Planctopirus limnophila]